MKRTKAKPPIAIIRQLNAEDEQAFIAAMQKSVALHHPWVAPPTTIEDFQVYLLKYQQPNNRSFLICDNENNIAGVFNINEIVLGIFQSAYLGYFGVAGYEKKGYMSSGLKLVLTQVFSNLSLHRVEANIQPDNLKSINLVKNNGFHKEGYSPRYLKVNGEWRDHERWAITFEDWNLLRSKNLS